MFGDDVGYCVPEGLLFQFGANPAAFGPFEDGVGGRVLGRQGRVVEIRRVVQVARRAVGADLDVEDPFRDETRAAGRGRAPVLDRVFDGEQHAGRVAVVTLVYEHRPAPQQIAVPLEGQVGHRVEQRMAGAHERR